MKKIIKTQKAPQAVGPYSQAVQVGGFIFCSGQIALRPDGGLVEGDIRDQVKQIMENIKAVLNEAGADLKDVVKSTIYLVDLGNFEVVNEVYGEYFDEDMPARSTVGVASLPKNAQVEIEVIAEAK